MTGTSPAPCFWKRVRLLLCFATVSGSLVFAAAVFGHIRLQKAAGLPTDQADRFFRAIEASDWAAAQRESAPVSVESLRAFRV